MAVDQSQYTYGELHHILSNEVRDLLTAMDKMQMAGEYNDCVALREQRQKVEEYLR